MYDAGGNPYGTSLVGSPGNGDKHAVLGAARHQGRRLAQIAARLAAGGRVPDAAGDVNGTEAGKTPQTA